MLYAQFGELKGKVLFFGKNERHNDYTLNIEIKDTLAVGGVATMSWPTLSEEEADTIIFSTQE